MSATQPRSGTRNLLEATSYCNSILQCLYYSAPFREQVVSYPTRSPLDLVNLSQMGLPRVNNNTALGSNGQPLSPGRARPPVNPSARNPGGPSPINKPEDKESPEYKKKMALAAGPVLNMSYDVSTNYGMKESLFTSLKDLFEAIIANRSRIGVVSPQKLLEVLRRENEMFRSAMHQDAHEFLNLLLNEVIAAVEVNVKEQDELEAGKMIESSAEGDGFERALATAMPKDARSPGNTRWVHHLFEGTLTSETRCLTCENVSQRDEPFLDLSVDLEQHSSVTSCLRKFSEEEMLCERNKFHCDNCGGLQEAEKRMKIKRLPKILALHLKRFKYTEDLQRLQKLFHRVVYPYHLRLFNTTDDAEYPDRLYELYAVVVHIGGGPYHGHYVSIIKTKDRGWLLFDDEMVEPVDKAYVQNFFGERPGLACAYVLFYQETTLEAVRKEQATEGRTDEVVIPETEGTGLGIKTNGVVGDGLHHVQSAASPVTEDEDHWISLDHAVTLPLLPLQPSPKPAVFDLVSNFAEHTVHSKNGDSQSKKERAKEEKERKAAEKDLEKAEKQRQKNLESRWKDELKQQEKESKTALDASRLSKAEEDRKHVIENGVKDKEHILLPITGLSRFRQTSKSISKRPKFWTAKDSSKDESVVDGEADDSAHPVNQAPEKHENKLKHRFSSLRKKSSNLLSQH